MLQKTERTLKKGTETGRINSSRLYGIMQTSAKTALPTVHQEPITDNDWEEARLLSAEELLEPLLMPFRPNGLEILQSAIAVKTTTQIPFDRPMPN